MDHEEAVRFFVESGVGPRLDNWHDIGLPYIPEKAAWALELAPALEHLEGASGPVNEKDVYEIFSYLYGNPFEDGWLEDLDPLKFKRAMRAVVGVDMYSVYMALVNLWDLEVV